MTIFELSSTSLRRAALTTFKDIGITERGDLQRLLRSQVEAIAPDTFVICEEFGKWEDSSRRIDLLALDRLANLVVIELKRTDDGGHMELQAIRYAAMVSTMTFQQVVEAHRKFRESTNLDGDASEAILSFLGWLEPQEDQFALDTRIVLASEDFSKEITTAVLWLNQRSLDIRCVRMKPYKLDDRVLVDVQQIIPLPEAAEYQVRIREKEEGARASRGGPTWDEARLMSAVEATKGSEARRSAESLLRWAESRFTRIVWGSGLQMGSWTVVLRAAGKDHFMFSVWSHGTIEIPFQFLANKPPFHDSSLREELRRRLNVASGIAIAADGITRRPPVPIMALGNTESMRLFRDAFEWALAEIESYVPPETDADALSPDLLDR